MLYCAIIGDIVNSKKIRNRQEVQDKFYSVLNEINIEFDIDITSNFTVTLGDEFQGLIYKPSISYAIIKKIKHKMAPVELVFGVGIGDMSTKIEKQVSIGADGPAYHYARNMVNKAKKKKPTIRYFSHSCSDELINSLLFFIESCSLSRTDKQIETIELYEALKSQYEVAKVLGKVQSSISSLLDNAFYNEVANAELQIKKFLYERYENSNCDRD